MKTVGGVIRTKRVTFWQHPARLLTIYNISLTGFSNGKPRLKFKSCTNTWFWGWLHCNSITIEFNIVLCTQKNDGDFLQNLSHVFHNLHYHPLSPLSSIIHHTKIYKTLSKKIKTNQRGKKYDIQEKVLYLSLTMFPIIHRNSLTRTYLNIRHGKIVPNTRAIFCTFCNRPQSDIHFSISFVNYSVCFSSNIKNFWFPPGWAFYKNAASIFFKGNFTLITKILAWTCRRLILRGKYIYVSFTKTLTVQIQASNRNSDSKLDWNGVSFFYSVCKRWGLEIKLR